MNENFSVRGFVGKTLPLLTTIALMFLVAGVLTYLAISLSDTRESNRVLMNTLRSNMEHQEKTRKAQFQELSGQLKESLEIVTRHMARHETQASLQDTNTDRVVKNQERILQELLNLKAAARP